MSKFLRAPSFGRLARPWLGSLAAASLVLLAAGCGGGGSGSAGIDESTVVSASTAVVSEAPSARIMATPQYSAGVIDPGLLLLLVPDTLSASDPGIAAWVDAASEVGARLAPITDSQFLALGTRAALGYAGLVMPDLLHQVATDAVVTAIHNYVTAGGRALLTYDFGSLTLNGNNQPVFPIPKSRFSDIAGVDYVLYDALQDRTVGLGPVTAMTSTLRELLVPPGKSLPYVAPTTVLAATTLQSKVLKGSASDASRSALEDAALASDEALYLPVTPADPGGALGFDPQQLHNLPQYSRRDKGKSHRPTVSYGKAAKGKKLPSASKLKPGSTTPEPTIDFSALATPADTLEAYSGYLLGQLIYPSYVTTGVYDGQVLAQAPDFGLAAGLRKAGAGQLLFVNLPLTYLKGRTDGLPMHGFLNYFVQHVMKGARLSTVPNGVPGMTLDWHLDSMEAQAPTLALEQAGVFKAGTFSIEMTAGPDAVVPGDGLGWNLNNNSVAKQFLRRMDSLGHAVGSHGGWIHDYYGLNADETNQSTFQTYLELNRSAVDGVIGHKSRGYSAPQGNNPNWAMTWLQQQGVVAAYFGGHTGLGVTRQYRDGVLRTPSLWVVPVTPQGLYATFEEFQDFGVPQQDVIDWYHGLVDFTMAQNTHRMVYAHPAGADDWRSVLQDLLSYAKAKGSSKFMWYTMPRMADYMVRRGQVTWKQTLLSNGNTRFDASHPSNLSEMVWVLPKARYLKPTVEGGDKKATVADGGGAWLVRARSVGSIMFQAAPNKA